MDEDFKVRYARQIAIPEIGMEGQEKLVNSKVLIIGCGALGSMAAMQLAAAGIGTLGIADYDTVDLSNLQRQFYFKTDEAGKSKVDLIKIRINDLNPFVNVISYSFFMTSQKATDIFEKYDFIIDATDNPESKRLTGEISRTLSKPCCVGGIRDFGGMVMTFQHTDPRLEEYFGEASADGFLPCSLSGVIGPAAALCASIQVSETIKYITGAGELLTGRILIFNLLNNSFHALSL